MMEPLGALTGLPQLLLNKDTFWSQHRKGSSNPTLLPQRALEEASWEALGSVHMNNIAPKNKAKGADPTFYRNLMYHPTPEPRFIQEKPQLRNFLDQTGLWACLWRIFWIAHWWGVLQFTEYGTVPRSVVQSYTGTLTEHEPRRQLESDPGSVSPWLLLQLLV